MEIILAFEKTLQDDDDDDDDRGDNADDDDDMMIWTRRPCFVHFDSKRRLGSIPNSAWGSIPSGAWVCLHIAVLFSKWTIPSGTWDQSLAQFLINPKRHLGSICTICLRCCGC